MEATEKGIARFLEKHCKDGRDWKEMEGDLRMLSVEIIKEFRELTKGEEPYSPARKHNQ